MRHIRLPMPRSLRHYVVATVTVFALTACSVATLAYNNAGMLIGYALGDYVELTPSQETWLKERVGVLIAWHRTNELPEWQRWLTETRERAGGNPQANDVQAVYDRGRMLLERTTEQMLPDIAALLRQLEPSQIAFLQDKFSRDNRKVIEDADLSPVARKTKRIKRIKERFESWMGDLTAEQQAYLQSRLAVLPALEEMRLADRIRWQRQLIELIKARPDAPALQAELRRMILAPEMSRDPDYQAALKRQQAEISAVAAWMVTNATPAQRVRLQKKFSGYAEDVASLLRT